MKNILTICFVICMIFGCAKNSKNKKNHTVSLTNQASNISNKKQDDSKQNKIQGTISIEKLSSLIGTWKSKLDEKYRDHPMIKKFNPDLKGHLTTFKWGVSNEVIHISIYNLDRPRKGDTIKFIDGMIIPNPATKTLKMIEYNAESDIYFDGTYEIDKEDNINRYYEVGFANGAIAKNRERWVWQNKNKTHFKWYTERYSDGKFQEGGVVVDYIKLNKN